MTEPVHALPPITTVGHVKNIGASIARVVTRAPSSNLQKAPARQVFSESLEDDDDDGGMAGIPADLAARLSRVKAPSQKVEPIIEDGHYTLANFAAKREPARQQTPAPARTVAPVRQPAPAPIVESSQALHSASVTAKALANLMKRR